MTKFSFELLEQLEGTGVQRRTFGHHLPVDCDVAAYLRDRMPLLDQIVRQRAQCCRRRSTTAAVQGSTQELLGVVAPIEEEILLAREVVEYRHFRNVCRGGHLVDRDLLEAASHE